MSFRHLSFAVWGRLTLAERRQLALIWLLILVSTGLETLGLGMVLPLVSVLSSDNPPRFITSVGSWLGHSSRESLVLIGALGLFGIYVCKNCFYYVSAHVQRRFLNGATSRIAQETYESFVRSPYEFHITNNSAKLINDVEISKVIVSGGLEPLLVLLTDGLVALGFFTVLVVVEPIGSATTIVFFCLAAWAFQKTTRSRVTKWGSLRKLHLGQVLQHLQQGLGGIKEVKIFGKEEQFLERHETHLRASMDVARKFMLLQLQPRLWLEVIGVGSLTVLIASMTAAGRPVPEILPVLGLFAAAAFRVIPSVGRILASIQSMTFSAPQIESLLGQQKPETNLSAVAFSEARFIERIRIRNVSYQYQGSEMLALDGVTFDLAPGEAIGLVGTSGAGKSTLVDVILGLLKPTQGEITVDGVDISTITRGWQRIIGYVPQAIYLLDDSIRKNVAFGFSDEEVNESALMRSLKAAQMDEFVMGLPDQTDTIIGERGVRLSGGQRQRIGIARALYHDPPILILDEATSALDKETEEGVMSSVQKMLGRKTILIVAHRLSTVAYCSRVLRLEQGRVVWVGHPHELIEQQTTSAEAVLKHS